MSQAVFHLGVTEADLNGATLAIIIVILLVCKKLPKRWRILYFLLVTVNTRFTAQS